MLRSLAKFSESEASNHAPSLADFITTMVGFKVFGTHTMIIVTHEIGFAREISSRMVFMMDGAIVVDGPPKEFFEGTVEPRLKSFLSKVL